MSSGTIFKATDIMHFIYESGSSLGDISPHAIDNDSIVLMNLADKVVEQLEHRSGILRVLGSSTESSLPEKKERRQT